MVKTPRRLPKRLQKKPDENTGGKDLHKLPNNEKASNHISIEDAIKKLRALASADLKDEEKKHGHTISTLEHPKEENLGRLLDRRCMTLLRAQTEVDGDHNPPENTQNLNLKTDCETNLVELVTKDDHQNSVLDSSRSLKTSDVKEPRINLRQGKWLSRTGKNENEQEQ